jgi:hypothetical protein
MANSLAVLRLAGKHFHVAALEGSGWIQRKWDHKLERTGVGVEKVSVFFGAPRLKPHYNERSVGLPALKQWRVSRLLLAHSRIEPAV